mmetsp:Transcript_1054/g.1263  ORF Transcript_1054/g.1263 Transcript_1054/m.1263 type:complete len:136 (+) Transcript_1054:228-635(+)
MCEGFDFDNTIQLPRYRDLERRLLVSIPAPAAKSSEKKHRNRRRRMESENQGSDSEEFDDVIRPPPRNHLRITVEKVRIERSTEIPHWMFSSDETSTATTLSPKVWVKSLKTLVMYAKRQSSIFKNATRKQAFYF